MLIDFSRAASRQRDANHESQHEKSLHHQIDHVASDAVLARLAEYVRGGRSLVVSLKSGFCNEFSTVRWEMAPGPLREAAGVHYQEFSSLRQPLALQGDQRDLCRDTRSERSFGTHQPHPGYR